MKNQCLSIYIHIPFCERKCNYCAFSSFCANEKEKEKYINLLCQEIEKRKCERPIRTIYIGGGTPSVLSCEQITHTIECLRKNYDLSSLEEFTIEANPNSITEEKLICWKNLGVNRVSVGVQVLNDEQLNKIGRLHTKKMAIEKLELVGKHFDNFSADLIIGLEGETGEKLISYAKQLIEKGVKHISCYLLEIYENTKLAQMIKENKYLPVGDEQMIDNFNELAEYLQQQKFNRYEISNFALCGYEGKHNLNYWRRGEYLGFGLSAHSFLDKCRFCNADSLVKYENGEAAKENLTQKEEVEEMIMLGLRCCEGVSISKLAEKGCLLDENSYFKDYVKQGILYVEGDAIKLNPKYYHISNTTISNLI